jgi:hypothetical protein
VRFQKGFLLAGAPIGGRFPGTRTITTVSRALLRRAASRAGLLRAAVHVASWTPFLTVVVASVRGNWRAFGDGAGIALTSWKVLGAHPPLVGQSTTLAHGLYDPGPLQDWLLAVPVHLDPVRGVLWGAALWCMAAASLAIEATWSVLGEIGGLLASGTILGMVAWMPALAVRPYWNPWFGAMFFLAALAAAWAVSCGRRWWLPVLVVTASVAAQAHLIFDVAAAALVLVALIVGLWDRFRARAGYHWVTAGLVAGMICWILPILQEFTGRVGNLTALARGQGAGPHTGLSFAMKTLTAFTQPPALWWQHVGHRLHPYLLIEARPAVFAPAIFAVTAATLFVAVLKLRSRKLASLVVICLLAGVAALVTFSRIPLTRDALSRLHYLIIAMFPVGLLFWLTVGSAVVLTCRQVISGRRAAAAERAGSHGQRMAVPGTWIRWAVRGGGAAAAALIVLASVPGALMQAPGFPGDTRRAGQVSVATGLIERALPSQEIALSVAASKPDRYQMTMGLAWALTTAGYDVQYSVPSALGRPMPRVKVLVRSNRIAVDITKTAASHP